MCVCAVNMSVAGQATCLVKWNCFLGAPKWTIHESSKHEETCLQPSSWPRLVHPCQIQPQRGKGPKSNHGNRISTHAKNNSCVDLSCLAILLDRQGTGAAVPWRFCLAHAMLSQRTTLIRDSRMECKTPRLLLGASCGSLILGVCRVCKRASPRGGFDGAQKVTSQSVSCTPLELWLRQM